MADANDPRPGDTDNKLLQKIINRLANLSFTGDIVGTTDGLTNTQLRAAAVEVSGEALRIVTAAFTRPTNTTAYAPQDVVNNGTLNMTFASVVSANGGTGYITKARLVNSSGTVTNGLFRMWLYSVNPTPIADNAQATLLFANRASRVGSIEFVFSTEGTGSTSAESVATNVNLPFVCGVASKDLFGVLVAEAAYAPAADEQFFVELTIDPN